MSRQPSAVRRTPVRAPRRIRPSFEPCEPRVVPSTTAYIAHTQAAGVAVPVVSMDQATGESVIAWDGPNSDVYFRTVPPNASPLPTVDTGTNITLNGTSGTTSDVISVSMNNNGHFVVAWVDHNNSNSSLNGEWFQRFNSAGAPVGSAKFAGFINVADHKFPAAGMDDNDDVVLVQSGIPISGRTRIDAEEFTPTNTTAGGFVVTTMSGNNGYAALSMEQATGSFVIAYDTPATPESLIADVFAPFATAGTTFVAGTDTQILGYSVAMNNHGEVALSWDDVNSSGAQTIKVGLFSSTGSPIAGGGTAYIPPSGYSLGATSIALNDSGTFATSWMDSNSPSLNYHVSINLGTPTLVTSTAVVSNYQHFVAIDKNGHYVVCWQGGGPSGNGVYGSYYP